MEQNQLQLVTYDQAKRLKALGFDWITDYYYTCEGKSRHFQFEDNDCYPDNWNDSNEEDSFCSAPTVALALKWCRDVKRVHSNISTRGVTVENECTYYGCIPEAGLSSSLITSLFHYYEQAESALLDKILTLLEQKL